MRLRAEHLKQSSLASPYLRPVGLQPLRSLTSLILALQLADVQRSNGVGTAQLGIDVEINPSKGRGLGLFALRDFEPGELIGPYAGVLASETDYIKARLQQRTSGDYGTAVSAPFVGRRLYVDAEPDGEARCLASYINHSIRRQNSEFTELTLEAPLPDVPFVRTISRVSAGSELFIDYGAAYWDDVPGLDKPWSVQRLIVDYV